ncbi:MAG: Hpt domain-containing protein, partial [Clostridia bacterium]|nr:Hpt domain-containing protein [Clostridia bacterium]
MSREDEYKALFFEETREHLEKMEECLIELERNPEQPDLINTLFRSVHTIKGSSAAMGYTNTSQLVHKMEDIIQGIRDGKSFITTEKLELFLKVYDHLSQFVEVTSQGRGEDELDASLLVEALIDMKNGRITAQKDDEKATDDANVFKVSSTLLEAAKSSIETGKLLLGIYLKTRSDSAFKTVRAWMAYEELLKHSQILASKPSRDRIDAIMVNEGETPPESIIFLVATDMSKGDLEAILTSELSEVELLHLEEIKLEGSILTGEYIDYNEQTKTYEFDEKSLAFSRLNLKDALFRQNDENAFDLQGLDEIMRVAKDLELILVEMCPNLQECRQNCSQIPILINGLQNI